MHAAMIDEWCWWCPNVNSSWWLKSKVAKCTICPSMHDTWTFSKRCRRRKRQRSQNGIWHKKQNIGTTKWTGYGWCHDDDQHCRRFGNFSPILQDIYIMACIFFFYFGLFLQLMYKMQCTLIYYYTNTVNFPMQIKLLSSSIAVSTRDFESRIHGIRA